MIPKKLHRILQTGTVQEQLNETSRLLLDFFNKTDVKQTLNSNVIFTRKGMKMFNSIPEILKRQIKILTFDQYGTIVDMQTGLTELVTPFLRDKGWTGNPNQFVTWWRRTHFEDSMIDALIDRGHTPYRLIGHRAVSQVLARANISYSQSEVEWLVSGIEKLKPFPDVIKSLNQLHKHYRLSLIHI